MQAAYWTRCQHQLPEEGVYMTLKTCSVNVYILEAQNGSSFSVSTQHPSSCSRGGPWNFFHESDVRDRKLLEKLFCVLWHTLRYIKTWLKLFLTKRCHICDAVSLLRLQSRPRLASLPGLPCFSSPVCVQYNTRKRKSMKNGEGLGSFTTWVTTVGRVGGHDNDVRLLGRTCIAPMHALMRARSERSCTIGWWYGVLTLDLLNGPNLVN